MDKLRAMAFFCRAVEAGSFSAAAQQLDVVASAVSKVVSALEHDLGFALLNRSTRSLSPTDEGGVYYEHCRRILADIEAAEGLGRRGAAEARGTLRIGMHPGLRHATLTRLGAFLDWQPELKIETVITNSASAVVDEGLDLVLHIGPLTDSGLVARRLGWTRPVVCASPAYLAAWGEPAHPEQLTRHRAVIFARRDEASNTRWKFSKGDAQCEVELTVRTVSRDGIGLVDAVLGGCGVARPFDIAARPLIAAGALREVLPEWSGERQAVTAVLPARSSVASAKVRLYMEHVEGLLDGQR